MPCKEELLKSDCDSRGGDRGRHGPERWGGKRRQQHLLHFYSSLKMPQYESYPVRLYAGNTFFEWSHIRIAMGRMRVPLLALPPWHLYENRKPGASGLANRPPTGP
jgi:hypothetical protein